MAPAIKTVTFGEIMLRLSPPGFERFFQSPVLQATFGGGEANVAVSLAQFGLDSYYVSRVPANPIGDGAMRVLRGEGVHTGFVQRGGDRLGIYFAETGASQRASTVVYDRANAAVGQIQPGDVPWAEVFAGASWFHTTGITPALGPGVADATMEAVRAARAAGAMVSLDLNYRAKLWTKPQAREIMRPLAAQSDVLIANEEDIQASLGLEVTGADVSGGHLDVAGYRAVAERVVKEFGVKLVAITLRESFSASRNGWSAVLFDARDGGFHQSQRYDVTLVDRIGGGDSFAAGLIYGLVTGRTGDAALRFAVAASALKQTIPGDLNRTSVAEVDRLVGGDASGRVQR
jgi:2-dehydro-3-deoxygluconokinase